MRIDPYKMLMLMLGMMLLAGCGEYEPAPSSPPSAVRTPPAPPAATTPKVEPPKAKTPAPKPEPPKIEPPAPKVQQPEPDTPRTEQQKAEFGVGAKGHDYGPGVLTTPLSIYFSIEERMVFNIKIPHAMQLFKGAENRLPKSHEEFMQRIIKENDIVLPTLRDGQRYVYDPKTGELMVEKPAQQ